MVISVAIGVLVGVLLVLGAYLAVPWLRGRVKVRKRFALHMKPGHGPTIEGLLVVRSRREFALLDAEILQGTGESQELAGRVRVLRENVFCLQEIE